MMKETVVVKNRLFEKDVAHILDCFVVEYYDGPKELVNLANNILFLWWDYVENGELWLYFKVSDSKFLHEYLANKIGIKDLANISRIALCERVYERYGVIEIFKWLNDEEKHKYVPNNVFLERNFLAEIRNAFDSHVALKVVDFERAKETDRYVYSTKLKKDKPISLFKETHEFKVKKDGGYLFKQLEYVYLGVA